MFTYNGTAVLQFDSPVTGNAGSGVTVTVRGASTPVAGLGGLANIYDFNESAIPNPLTTDSKGNYTFKALNGTYDIILSEGDPTEVILPSQQFVDLTEVSIGVAQEVQTLTDGQTVVTFTSQTTTSAEFHINGQGVDSRLLTSQDINGALTTPTTITLFDSYPGGSIVTLSKNTDAGNTVAGIVIPTVEEEVVLTDGQLVVTFSTLTTEYSEFHINGIGVDSRLLTSDDINHSLTTPSTITLFESYPVGSIVTLAQNSTKGNISVDITNNIIKDLSQAYEFDTLQDAIVSTVVLPVGKVLNLKERSTGNGGGATWDVVLSSGVTENGYNIVQCTGVPTLSLVLRVGDELFASQWGVLADGVTDDSLALQFCIDNAAQKPVKLPYGTTRCGGITASTSVYGYGSIASFLLDRDGLAPVLTLNGGTKSLFFRDFRINGLGQGTGEAFKLGTDSLISNDMELTNIYIKGFGRGLFSEELDQIWGSVFKSIRIDETDYAFEFLGNAAGYTTMTFIKCFAAISKVGWNMQVFEGLTMVNCAADAATEVPMNFNYCRGTVINGVYIENSQLGTQSTPNLIKTFNCDGFSIDGLVINNNSSTNPIYMFQVNGSGANLVFRNAKITNQPTMKIAEIGASCTKANTNITMSGFDNYDILFTGDASIRLPDFENIAFIQNTNASGRITVAYSTYNIPAWLQVFPTTGLGISAGIVQPYFLSNYLYSTAFTCDVYSGVDGTNVLVADIPIVVNLCCRRI